MMSSHGVECSVCVLVEREREERIRIMLDKLCSYLILQAGEHLGRGLGGGERLSLRQRRILVHFLGGCR